MSHNILQKQGIFSNILRLLIFFHYCFNSIFPKFLNEKIIIVEIYSVPAFEIIIKHIVLILEIIYYVVSFQKQSTILNKFQLYCKE